MVPALLLLCFPTGDVHVKTVMELRSAVTSAKPGTRIMIAPGRYEGGLHFTNVHGEEGNLIEIAGADPDNPPVFSGGGSALQFSEVSYLELRDITVSGARGNGFNIDDGGTVETPSHHLTLVNLRVSDLPEGNHDGIKLSGVDQFTVVGCRIERWGGSAIDMVGCHAGSIQNSTFSGGDSNGVQMKGGTSDITVRGCRFKDTGDRGVNIGGSTGLEYFRPPVAKMEPGLRYEAARITVERNVFVGSTAPIAFVGSRDTTVRFNTIYRPKRWAIRILQETVSDDFIKCGTGEFTDNLIVFQSDQWFSGGVNVGPKTEPASFRFRRNFWFCADSPGRSRPALPVDEEDGVYGADPRFKNPDQGDFEPSGDSPARFCGAMAVER